MARVTREELVKMAEAAGAGALDDLVHDAFARNASRVNNEGADSQVQSLLEMGWSPETIEEEIQSIAARSAVGPGR